VLLMLLDRLATCRWKLARCRKMLQQAQQQRILPATCLMSLSSLTFRLRRQHPHHHHQQQKVMIQCCSQHMWLSKQQYLHMMLT
jgi:hypothetical protein